MLLLMFICWIIHTWSELQLTIGHTTEEGPSNQPTIYHQLTPSMVDRRLITVTFLSGVPNG
jgi:hypothetical protein